MNLNYMFNVLLNIIITNMKKLNLFIIFFYKDLYNEETDIKQEVLMKRIILQKIFIKDFGQNLYLKYY